MSLSTQWTSPSTWPSTAHIERPAKKDRDIASHLTKNIASLDGVFGFVGMPRIVAQSNHSLERRACVSQAHTRCQAHPLDAQASLPTASPSTKAPAPAAKPSPQTNPQAKAGTRTQASHQSPQATTTSYKAPSSAKATGHGHPKTRAAATDHPCHAQPQITPNSARSQAHQTRLPGTRSASFVLDGRQTQRRQTQARETRYPLGRKQPFCSFNAQIPQPMDGRHARPKGPR